MTQRKTLKKLFFIFLSGLLVLSACSELRPEATPAPQPEIEEPVIPIVGATGVVVPTRWTTLSVTRQGVISELAVNPDQVVETGDLLLSLRGEENLQAAIAAAQFELFSARQALDALYKDTDVRLAEALQAEVQYEQAVKDAQRYLDNLGADAPESDINQARANLILSREKLERAQKDYKPYEKKREDNLMRAALLSKLAQAQKEYEAAVRRLNNLEGQASNLTVREAEADLALAQAQLKAAQNQVEIYQNGPDPDDIEAAEERIANVEAQLAAAQAALEDREVIAPFSGTVSEVYVHPAEWVAPGQPVLVLADLKHLRVETTDLNEIDVARISAGDRAAVTFDALPEVVVSGEVARIATKAASGSGVNYTVVIELDEIPSELRWGMTAFVDIQVEQ